VIGSLKGRLAAKQPPQVLVEAGGVGYEVEVPMSTAFALPEVGAEVTLLTHLVVRDDAHLLYGFATKGERDLFRALIKINGVGPKLALTVLSGISRDAFVVCVRDGDVAQLTRLPGIGKKTAERLIVELKDRVGAMGALSGAPDTSPSAEAISALESLGYRNSEATKMVQAVGKDATSAEDIIRRALQRALRG
jgi:Holliday junction DNA helicase RuvA